MRKIRTIIYGREQGQKIPSIGGIFCPCFICPIFNTVLRFCRFSLYFYQYNEIMIDQNKMNVARRTCGYIGTQYWNQGRTEEIRDRVLHL